MQTCAYSIGLVMRLLFRLGLYIFIDSHQLNVSPIASRSNFLLSCELYDEERNKLRRKVGVQGMRTSVLLGDSTTIKDTIEYIENTGRFKLEQV